MKEKYKNLIIMIIFMLFAGFLSISLGMERHWDTRNYHIYNPYAFLNDRFLTDIMPAGIQSYFNPLLDIPYYLFIKYFNNHPMFVTGLWGFSYALLLFMVYKISELVFKDNKYHLIFSIISVIIASGISEIVKIVGWLSHDLFVGDLALIAIYILLKTFNKQNNKKYILLAGFIIGCAVGFKLTAIIFAIATILAFLAGYKNFHKPLKAFGILLFGMLCGFLLTDGFWLCKLYSLFSNPFFPYFNWLFHNDMINASNVYSVDFGSFTSQKFYEKIFLAFIPHSQACSISNKLLWILFALNILTLPFIKREKFNKYFKVKSEYVDFMLIFVFFTYVVWINTFGFIRYFSPILALLGVFYFVVLMKIYFLVVSKLDKITEKHISEFKLARNIYIAMISVALFVMIFPKYNIDNPKKLVRVPLQEKLIDIEKLNIPDNSIVLVNQGMGIFIPFQNPNVKYIHINSYHFTRKGESLLSDNQINEIKNIVKANSNKVYILTDFELENPKENNIKAITNIKKKKALHYTLIDLNKLNINIEKIKCKTIDNNIYDNKYSDKYKHPTFYFCKAEIM